MTTIESGSAINHRLRRHKETRAVAIHEAGHEAIASHIYGEGTESTLIRMRGGSLGHHQAIEKEERFSKFRSERGDRAADLDHGRDRRRAEFDGENSRRRR